jgi:hypothetical protein
MAFRGFVFGEKSIGSPYQQRATLLFPGPDYKDHDKET